MISGRLPSFLRADLQGEQQALYDAIVTGPRAQGPQAFPIVDVDGALRGPFNAMLTSPAVGTALQALGAACRYGTSLSDRARELAILVVANQWRSSFEIESHEAVGAAAGLTAAELACVRDGRLDDLVDPTERIVASTAYALATGGDLTDDAYARAVATLGPATVFELTTIVGYYATLAMQLRVFRV